MNSKDERKPRTNGDEDEEGEKIYDWGEKPLLVERPDIDGLNEEPDSIPSGTTNPNTNVNKTGSWSTHLWTAKVIFLQLCAFAGLAFLYDNIATKVQLKATLEITPEGFAGILVLLCIYPSIRLNKIFLINFPKCQPFAWGYFNSLWVILIGIYGVALGIWRDSGDSVMGPSLNGSDLITLSIMFIGLGMALYLRNRGAWVVFTSLAYPPAGWLINGTYLRNRWQEMK